MVCMHWIHGKCIDKTLSHPTSYKVSFKKLCLVDFYCFGHVLSSFLMTARLHHLFIRESIILFYIRNYSLFQ